MDTIRWVWNDGIVGKCVVLFLAFTIGFLPFAIYAGIEEARAWDQYKVDHQCKLVGKQKGHTSAGVMPIIGGKGGMGVMITSTPDKTGWLCDDGVTYWR